MPKELKFSIAAGNMHEWLQAGVAKKGLPDKSGVYRVAERVAAELNEKEKGDWEVIFRRKS